MDKLKKINSDKLHRRWEEKMIDSKFHWQSETYHIFPQIEWKSYEAKCAPSIMLELEANLYREFRINKSRRKKRRKISFHGLRCLINSRREITLPQFYHLSNTGDIYLERRIQSFGNIGEVRVSPEIVLGMQYTIDGSYQSKQRNIDYWNHVGIIIQFPLGKKYLMHCGVNGVELEPLISVLRNCGEKGHSCALRRLKSKDTEAILTLRSKMLRFAGLCRKGDLKWDNINIYENINNNQQTDSQPSINKPPTTNTIDENTKNKQSSRVPNLAGSRPTLVRQSSYSVRVGNIDDSSRAGGLNEIEEAKQLLKIILHRLRNSTLQMSQEQVIAAKGAFYSFLKNLRETEVKSNQKNEAIEIHDIHQITVSSKSLPSSSSQKSTKSYFTRWLTSRKRTKRIDYDHEEISFEEGRFAINNLLGCDTRANAISNSLNTTNTIIEKPSSEEEEDENGNKKRRNIALLEEDENSSSSSNNDNDQDIEHVAARIVNQELSDMINTTTPTPTTTNENKVMEADDITSNNNIMKSKKDNNNNDDEVQPVPPTDSDLGYILLTKIGKKKTDTVNINDFILALFQWSTTKVPTDVNVLAVVSAEFVMGLYSMLGLLSPETPTNQHIYYCPNSFATFPVHGSSAASRRFSLGRGRSWWTTKSRSSNGRDSSEMDANARCKIGALRKEQFIGVTLDKELYLS